MVENIIRPKKAVLNDLHLFHALEDRLVKSIFRNWIQEHCAVNIAEKLRPDEEEVENNIKSRSAVMRAIEKTVRQV